MASPHTGPSVREAVLRRPAAWWWSSIRAHLSPSSAGCCARPKPASPTGRPRPTLTCSRSRRNDRLRRRQACEPRPRRGRTDRDHRLRAQGRGGTTGCGGASLARGARRGVGRTARSCRNPLTATRTSLLVLLSLCAVACARLDRVTGTPVDDGSTERQVLVMLRLTPPHFRPDVRSEEHT